MKELNATRIRGGIFLKISFPRKLENRQGKTTFQRKIGSHVRSYTELKKYFSNSE